MEQYLPPHKRSLFTCELFFPQGERWALLVRFCVSNLDCRCSAHATSMPYDASCFNGGNLNGQFDATCALVGRPARAQWLLKSGNPNFATVLRNALAPLCPTPHFQVRIEPLLLDKKRLFLLTHSIHWDFLPSTADDSLQHSRTQAHQGFQW